MESINILFNEKYKKIGVNRIGFFNRFFGLMFRSKNTTNLLFDFSRDVRISIHSLFVFFPFLIIWLDKHNRVLEFRAVKPFQIYINAKKEFRRFIEIPFSKNNHKLVNSFLGGNQFETC